jgi:hypothetical protein
LDRETVKSYDLIALASNNCEDKPDSLDGVWNNSTISLKIKVREGQRKVLLPARGWTVT